MNSFKHAEFGVVIISTYTDEITIAFRVPVDDNGTPTKWTQCDAILLYDFIRCFRFRLSPVSNGVAVVLPFDKPIVFDGELKNRIVAFVAKYSKTLPELKAIPSQLDKIKAGTSVFIADVKVRGDHLAVAKRLNQLLELQGMGVLPKTLLDFMEKYEYCSVGREPHTFIGHKNKSERICRWCGRTLADGATFNKKGHAISESLGNKNIILYDECDACNGLFGNTIEETVATYYSFENVLFGVHGKKGIPKVKSSDRELIENKGNSHLSMHAVAVEQNGDEPPRQVTIKAPKKIAEQDVYRCFCKYALSCCKDDIFAQFKHLVPWLKRSFDYDKTPWVLAYRHLNLDAETGNMAEQPIMNMYIRRDEDNTMPFFICELHHTIRTHVFILPRDEDERVRFASRENCMSVWRKLPFIQESSWENIYDMSGTIPHDHKCVMNFELKTSI